MTAIATSHSQPAASTIEELDNHLLSSLRILWQEARDPKEKETWRRRLDEALDDRLRLMRLRDHLPINSHYSTIAAS